MFHHFAASSLISVFDFLYKSAAGDRGQQLSYNWGAKAKALSCAPTLLLPLRVISDTVLTYILCIFLVLFCLM